MKIKKNYLLYIKNEEYKKLYNIDLIFLVIIEIILYK